VDDFLSSSFLYQRFAFMILIDTSTLFDSIARHVSKTNIAEYARKNSETVSQLPVDSYVQTRSYTRSAAAV